MRNSPSTSLWVSLRALYEAGKISLPTVLESFFCPPADPKAVYDTRLASFSEKVLANAQVDLQVLGREHMDPKAVYVVMSNHASLYDIPVLFVVFGGSLRMVGKKELFRIPVFGGALRRAGFVEIDRSDHARAVEALADATKQLHAGVHVWIAPEGTRSRTGELLPFKKGGFHVARSLGLSILPVALVGTQHVLPAKGVRTCLGQSVRVVIQPPVNPADYGHWTQDTRTRLLADVRASIARGLQQGTKACSKLACTHRLF